MSTVYVVQQPMRRVSREDVSRGYYGESALGTFVPTFDMSPALEYGNIELLLDSGVFVGIATMPMIRSFQEKLRGYGDDDFLILTGNPVAMGLATAIACNYNHGTVNILQWDRKQRKYIKTVNKAW
jgi:hypothetical protein